MAIFCNTSIFLQHLYTHGTKTYMKYFNNNSKEILVYQYHSVVWVGEDSWRWCSPNPLIKAGSTRILYVCICYTVKCFYQCIHYAQHYLGEKERCWMITRLCLWHGLQFWEGMWTAHCHLALNIVIGLELRFKVSVWRI